MTSSRAGMSFPSRITEACNSDDVNSIAELIERASQRSGGGKPQVLDIALMRAVKRNALKVVAYLLQQGADVSKLDGSSTAPLNDFLGSSLIGDLPTRELVEMLVAHGWDISNGEHPLLWIVIGDYDWVAWCLAHGAKVTPHESGNPNRMTFTERFPILQYAAETGDIAAFELLRSHGAPVSQAVLPSAVRAASRLAPQDSSESSGEKYKKLLAMVTHLLDVVKIDVNIFSAGVAAGAPSGSSCSTPLCCVARSSKGETRELVWLLLDRGGDPRMAGKWEFVNGADMDETVPSALEAHADNERFRQAVEDWEARKRMAAS